MPEKIDPTWLVYALASPEEQPNVEAGLERVERHYGQLVDYPLARRAKHGRVRGLAVLVDAEPRCRWPHFAEDQALSIATAYVPTGWHRLVGQVPAADAALPLGRAVLAAPDSAIASLVPPVALAVLDHQSERLVIINDYLGAARLYELRYDGGVVWSNRAGALPLFAGTEPHADERGWQIFAAMGWFLGNATSLQGVTRVAPGSVIEVTDRGVHTRESGAIADLVSPSSADLDELLPDAADAALSQVSTADSLWEAQTTIDLSGGRDSRLVAAAAVAAGVEARFHTSDETEGEAAVARQLVSLLPGTPEHRVRRAGGHTAPTMPLMERALNTHLLHDGMRHAQKLRTPLRLPRSRPLGATLSGHGGDLARGYFYRDRSELRRIKRAGDEGVRKRLKRYARKKHRAASGAAYAAAEAEADRTIEQGKGIGVAGPTLLEWFYLMHRFAHRQGLATHAERVSVFSTPAFIRVAFAIEPKQRFAGYAHQKITARLMPAWRDVPYFRAEPGAMRTIRRRRLWENPTDAPVVEELIAGGGAWTEIYDPDRVREAWGEVKAGGGRANWEAVFDGVVYRAAFDEYLRRLASDARQVRGPPRPVSL